MFDVKNSAPMRMIKKYNHLYPDAWDFIENIATNEEYKDMWPHEYVYAPIEAGLTFAVFVTAYRAFFPQNSFRMFFRT